MQNVCSIFQPDSNLGREINIINTVSTNTNHGSFGHIIIGKSGDTFTLGSGGSIIVNTKNKSTINLNTNAASGLGLYYRKVLNNVYSDVAVSAVSSATFDCSNSDYAIIMSDALNGANFSNDWVVTVS